MLVANIRYWPGWVFMTPEQQQASAGADVTAWQYRFHHLLIGGKFYTVFSLLFELLASVRGRLCPPDRAAERARGRWHADLRRLVLVLLAIGLTHSLLIWDGDILTLYALLGLLLPFFYEWSERRLLIAAALLIFVVPFLGIWLFAQLGWAPQQYLYALADAIAWSLAVDPAPGKVLAWLRRNDWRSRAAWQGSATIYSGGLRIESWRIAKVLGVMLIGLVAGRRLVTGGILDNRRLLRRVSWAGLAIGLPGSLAYALIPRSGQGS